MTFPFQPHRKPSDDDELDRQLNDWVAGTSSVPASDHAADAIEFHRWANETRRSDPAATGPAAGTISRVLRNTVQESPNRSSAMSSATMTAQAPGFSRVPAQSFRQRSSRYATLAATVALVLAVAFGGWLAMSQMPGGNGEGRYALMGQSESRTCDVEPMTVDEVMEIVENPYLFYYESKLPSDHPLNVELAEGSSHRHSVLPKITPTVEEFESASEVANGFLPCFLFGTSGQQWRFMNPLDIQAMILTEIPIYRDESAVRSYIENRLSQPGDFIYYSTMESVANSPDFESITVNPDREIAVQQVLSHSEPMEKIVTMGVVVYKTDGGIMLSTNANGSHLIRPEEGPLRVASMTVTVVKSSESDQWFIAFPEGWFGA